MASFPYQVLSISYQCHCIRLTPDAVPVRRSHAPSWIFGKDPSACEKKLHTCQSFHPFLPPHMLLWTYGRNGAGRRQDPHRGSHDSPTISLDQGTCDHGAEKRGGSHGAIEEGECLGVSAAGAEGARIGPFFFFDDGG